MKTIALVTDFGYTDNFAGVMKGVILKGASRVNIIDITHGISSHNIKEGAFILFKSYKFFPKKTIFLAVVDPGVGTERKILMVKTNNYYFIGPDNGILYPAVKDDVIRRAVSFDTPSDGSISSTFHGRDVFAPLAAELAKSEKIFSQGVETKSITPLSFPKPEFDNGCFLGNVLYIDKFGNIVTNITREELKMFEDTGFTALLNNKKIEKFRSVYYEAPSGEPFFIEGSFGYLEISLNGESARDYFGLRNTDKKIILSRYNAKSRDKKR